MTQIAIRRYDVLNAALILLKVAHIPERRADFSERYTALSPWNMFTMSQWPKQKATMFSEHLQLYKYPHEQIILWMVGSIWLLTLQAYLGGFHTDTLRQTNSLALKMAIEIVDLPIYSMVIFQFVFCMFTRPGTLNHRNFNRFSYWNHGDDWWGSQWGISWRTISMASRRWRHKSAAKFPVVDLTKKGVG